MKNILFLFAFIMGLSGCSTYKDIAKHAELTEGTLKAKMIPGNKYRIILHSGQELKIRVTHVDSLAIYGYEQVKSSEGTLTQNSFSDSYARLQKNAKSISVKKPDSWATAAAIVVPIGILYGAAIYSVSNEFDL